MISCGTAVKDRSHSHCGFSPVFCAADSPAEPFFGFPWAPNLERTETVETVHISPMPA